MFEIIPGILEKEWEDIEKKLELVKPFAKAVHIDLLDGKFANNMTFLDPKPFKKYAQDFRLELHMMVENPIQYLEPWANAGFQRFIGHIEKMPDQIAFVAQAQLLGEVGLALDGPTPVTALQVPLNDLDCLLVMTVNAGFSGQQFSREYLKKVDILHTQTMIPIEVDGGLTDLTISQALSAGACRFVTTSSLYGKEDVKKQFLTLESKLPLTGF